MEVLSQVVHVRFISTSYDTLFKLEKRNDVFPRRLYTCTVTFNSDSSEE